MLCFLAAHCGLVISAMGGLAIKREQPPFVYATTASTMVRN